MNSHSGRILVVEDDPSLIQLFKVMLELDGHVVRAVPDATLALKTAVEMKPDLVLLDLNMPEMHGFDVARQFENCPDVAGARIVFVSGDSTECEGLPFLAKPFRPDQLRAFVREQLEIRAGSACR